MSWILALLSFFMVSFLLYTLIRAAVKFAPWFPTRRSDYERIFRLANLERGGVFFDLGCGTGGVTLFMARKKGVKAVGVEYVFPLYALAKLRAWLSGSEALVIWGDFFKQNLRSADVVFLFGLSETLTRDFYEQLKSKCRPGVRFITYVFGFEGVEPLLVDKPSPDVLTIRVYE